MVVDVNQKKLKKISRLEIQILRLEKTMEKIVNFYYKRDSLPHSEFQVRKQLEKFLVEDSNSFVIITSTASIFLVVLSFCSAHSFKINARYEGAAIEIDKNYGIHKDNWKKYLDFVELDKERLV